MTRLTPAAARDMKPGQILHDHEITGLQLRCRETVKSFHLQYRTKSGVQRCPKLGTFPELNLKRARELAQEMKDLVRRGSDPVAEWKAAKAVPTVAAVCDRYLKEWAEPRLAPNSIRMHTQLIEAQIKPGLGKKRLTEVTRADVDTFLRRVFNRELLSPDERKRVGPTAHWTAMHTRRLLSRIYSTAIHYFEIDCVKTNPVSGSIPYGRRKRKRHATLQEMPRIAHELQIRSETNPSHVACIWVMLLTGGRVREILNARADQIIDTGDGRRVIHLTRHKTWKRTGDKDIPLPHTAIEIIERYGCPEGRIFGDLSYDRLIRFWRQVRTAAGCPGLKLLDMRRTFASYGLSRGLSLEQIGGQLGHTDVQVTKGYSYLLDEVRIELADRVANAIMQAARPSQSVETSSSAGSNSTTSASSMSDAGAGGSAGTAVSATGCFGPTT